MDAQHPPDSDPASPPRGQRADASWRLHLLAYGLLGTLLAGVLISRWFYPLVARDDIGVVPDRAHLVETRIDPNTADWNELATLPEMGETTARAVVAYRQERIAAGAPPPVFAAAEDLLAIPGIGPRTLERIRPHLRFAARH